MLGERYPVYVAIMLACVAFTSIIDQSVHLAQENVTDAQVFWIGVANIQFFVMTVGILSFVSVSTLLTLYKKIPSDFGRYDWKLWLALVLMGLLVLIPAIVTDAVGNGYYWSILNERTANVFKLKYS